MLVSTTMLPEDGIEMRLIDLVRIESFFKDGLEKSTATIKRNTLFLKNLTRGTGVSTHYNDFVKLNLSDLEQRGFGLTIFK